MESIGFSYTRGERTRCALQPGASGPSTTSFVVMGLLMYWIVDGLLSLTGHAIGGLGFIGWLYAFCSISIIGSLIYDVYKATAKFAGSRRLQFDDKEMAISVEGQSISMTGLKGFGLVSPAIFLLCAVDDTVTVFPKRIFDSPDQIERFKRCGNGPLENYKRHFATRNNEAENTAR